VIGQVLIEIVDLKKCRVAIGFERTEVVFAVWVVGVAEIVINGLRTPSAEFALGTSAEGPRKGDLAGAFGRFTAQARGS